MMDGGALAQDFADGPTQPEAAARPGPGRLLFRFWLGVAALARDRMNAILAVSGTPAPLTTTTGQSAPGAMAAALGLLLDVTEVGSRVQPALSARCRNIAASVRRLAAPLARAGGLVAWLPGVPRRAAELRTWLARGETQFARWAAAGRRERTESRAVARAALTTMREAVLARISESPDVKRVIHEQSAGIAVTAVGELRERSARIDDLAEGAVGRLLGRGRGRRSR